MKVQSRFVKILLPLAATCALSAMIGCAPDNSTSGLTTPPPANLPFPSTNGQPPQTDLSGAPAAIHNFLGVYEGQLSREEFGGVWIPQAFRMTLERQQNTTGSGPSAWATVKFELTDVPGFTPIYSYMGFDPVPYHPYGPSHPIYILMSSAMNSTALSYRSVAILMQMGVNPATHQFDPTWSRIDFYDCGLSKNTVCSNRASDVRFDSVTKKR